jgi:hypothetical protein
MCWHLLRASAFRNLCQPENPILHLLRWWSQLRMGKPRISSRRSIYLCKIEYELVSKTALDASVAYFYRPQPTKISTAQGGLTNIRYGVIISRTPGQFYLFISSRLTSVSHEGYVDIKIHARKQKKKNRKKN